MRTLRKVLSIALVSAVFFGSAAPAWANSNAQIEQLRAMLEEQDALDASDAAAKDRQMARKWLEEAEVLAANGKDSAAKRRIKRAEFAVELVTALVAAGVVRQKAEAQEAAAFGAPETLAALQADVDALQKKKSELQNELKVLQQQTR